MPVKVILNDCIGCGCCVGECPAMAITCDEKAKIDPEICDECGSCVNSCPTGAMTWE
ncbi:MAG: 4Fe-4S binding protein [Erysipelotrichaceae bacterium]|nr:4Fe-4S binding protein [Erysipelotrichaceae bacterium]